MSSSRNTLILWQYTASASVKIDFKYSLNMCDLLVDIRHSRLKLTKLILLLPVTNATREKTFSLLKLIKSYLRSTMKQSRLNHLILSGDKNQLDQLDLIKIAFDFVSKNDVCKHIFVKFNYWLPSMYIAYFRFFRFDIFQEKRI